MYSFETFHVRPSHFAIYLGKDGHANELLKGLCFKLIRIFFINPSVNWQAMFRKKVVPSVDKQKNIIFKTF